MKKYIPLQIEQKWQKRWSQDGLYASDLNKQNKYYVLAEFAYPSGDLHMGHWFTWAGADIFARFKRMQGYDVFFPNGFDAFGLPAENAAIKRGIHPRDWTISNIEKMKQQYQTMGGSFTFDHEVVTCDRNYYHWNQWIFLKMLEKGIAYRGKSLSNWCESCQTVLANEGVEAGRCWRCGSEIVQKQVEQWFFKITEYADRLIWPKKSSVDWPKAVRDAQNKWIGKSEGMDIDFSIEGLKDKLTVFTSYPETIFGVTYMVIAPEHHLVGMLTTSEQKDEMEKYIQDAKKKSEMERTSLEKLKTGVFTGAYAINPVNEAKVPIWVADYVIGSYGTGAVMGVPGSDIRDFGFAKAYSLPIIRVIGESANDSSEVKNEKCVLEEGYLVNSQQFSGLKTPDAGRDSIKKWLEEKSFGRRKTQYHLHDWSVSRQRYWGTPIPVIHCSSCGIVPVLEKDLPVELPYDVDYNPKGRSPLATNEEWSSVKCPGCGEKAQRDPDTMDTFVDSSWYFFRYLDPNFDKAPFEQGTAKKMMPVDIYFGGAEHTLGHTLYSRFFTKFFKDRGLTDLEEYAQKRVNHGIVLGPDGNKMSKSKGNVVNPDDEVKKYGGDAVRIHVSFFMPYDGTGPWISERIWGPYHFLERVWNMFDLIKDKDPHKEDLVRMNQTIKKVGNDINEIKFNTAIASLMEWLNHLSRRGEVSIVEYKTFLKLLSPFAPHITEELWEMIGGDYSIHTQGWPEVDEKYLQDEVFNIAVQVNGKVREILQIQKDMVNSESDIEKLAISSPKVGKFLGGKNPRKVIYIPGKILSIVV